MAQYKQQENQGQFFIQAQGETVAWLDVDVEGGVMRALHTEVLPSGAGKGYGKELVEALKAHAREKGLKVKALCPFVHAQFKRNPDAVRDIWLRM